MVKKLILAVKEGGVSGSGLLCRTSLLAFLFTLPAFNRGRGCRFFEVFCGYGDQVPTCKITMRNKHAFSYCTYNWLHDFLVGVCSSSRAPLATLTLFPPMVKKLIFASEEGKFSRPKAHAASRS